MKISCTQFSSCKQAIRNIMSALHSIKCGTNNNAYTIAIEDYWVQSNFFYVVLLRIRFKSAVLKRSLNDLIADKNLLEQLNSYDAYFLGILSYMQQQQMMTNNLLLSETRIDSDHMVHIPCIEFLGADHTTNKLIFKLIDLQTPIKIDIRKICSDKTIIAAMSNQSAFEVGRVVSHYFMEGYLI